MHESAGIEFTRAAQIPWEDRVNVDGWPSRAGLYYEDRAAELCLRLIHYPAGSIEPRHVHAGTHATTVLEGRARVDGLELGPLDVIVGPGGEPHGPLAYPEGCRLFSAFQGSYYHTEARELSGTARYRLIRSAQLPWRPCGAWEAKTLVAEGCGRLVLEALRFAPRAELPAGAPLPFRFALVVAGELWLGAERLAALDFLHARTGAAQAPIALPQGATLLALRLAP